MTGNLIECWEGETEGVRLCRHSVATARRPRWYPNSVRCPCGGEEYETCCGPYIEGQASAPTAEALMRSRYSAYVVGQIEYIGKTHAPSKARGFDPESARQWSRRSQWHGLKIVHTEAGGSDDDTGIVEFIAKYSQGAGVLRHHERSWFVKVDGEWRYESGQMVNETSVRSVPKVGRNEPCPCGSGKKFKKCCGRPGASAS